MIRMTCLGKLCQFIKLVPAINRRRASFHSRARVRAEPPRDLRIWESTRFCADQERAPRNIAALLMLGMLEFGVDRGLEAYVSVSDIRMEPIMRRAGWNPKRLGGTIATGTDTAAAERLTVSREYLIRVRTRAAVERNIIQNLHELDREAAVA